MPVPDPCMRRWQRRGVKPGVMSKERPTHPVTPGYGKVGRVNVSESLIRLRHGKAPERWVSKTALLG